MSEGPWVLLVLCAVLMLVCITICVITVVVVLS